MPPLLHPIIYGMENQEIKSSLSKIARTVFPLTGSQLQPKRSTGRWGTTTHWQGLDVEDQEMEGEGEDDGTQQPEVDPRRHPDQGLVLRQAAGGGMGGVRGQYSTPQVHTDTICT